MIRLKHLLKFKQEAISCNLGLENHVTPLMDQGPRVIQGT